MTGPRNPCPKDGFAYLTTVYGADVWEMTDDPDVILIHADGGYVGVHSDHIDLREMKEAPRE